jgi:hypothetical protein
MDNLQLRPTFPDKRLIKTYDALWESCRSIAPLQLLFLEIFKFVDNFWSFVISKAGPRNKNGRRRRAAAPARASAASRPRGDQTLVRCTDGLGVSAVEQAATVGPPSPLTPAYAAPRQRAVPGKAPTRPCASLP